MHPNSILYGTEYRLFDRRCVTFDYETVPIGEHRGRIPAEQRISVRFLKFVHNKINTIYGGNACKKKKKNLQDANKIDRIFAKRVPADTHGPLGPQ